MAHKFALDHPDFIFHAKQLAKKHLAETMPARWTHVKAVAHKVKALADQLLDDDEVIVATVASWLHDIGYGPALAKTGFHPLDGARWLEELECDKRIVNLVAHHSFAAIEAKERGLQKEMLAYENEKGLVVDILLYADLTTGPEGQTVTVEERIDEIISRYGEDHVVSRFIKRAKDDIMMAEERVKNKLGLDRPL